MVIGVMIAVETTVASMIAEMTVYDRLLQIAGLRARRVVIKIAARHRAEATARIRTRAVDHVRTRAAAHAPILALIREKSTAVLLQLDLLLQALLRRLCQQEPVQQHLLQWKLRQLRQLLQRRQQKRSLRRN